MAVKCVVFVFSLWPFSCTHLPLGPAEPSIHPGPIHYNIIQRVRDDRLCRSHFILCVAFRSFLAHFPYLMRSPELSGQRLIMKAFLFMRIHILSCVKQERMPGAMHKYVILPHAS